MTKRIKDDIIKALKVLLIGAILLVIVIEIVSAITNGELLPLMIR